MLVAMYEKFFGLQRDPFSIAPDPRYLFMSEQHREALAHLLYGLDAGGGFVLLSGDIGTGKTTVCRCFLEQIPNNCNVAYIFNPKLTVRELLSSVCDEFHVRPLRPVNTAKDLIDPLNSFLLAAHAAGQNNVLVIDEAQNLSSDVLEQLRLLTNLETNERKLLQIILIGQPTLRDMLARPELEQLAQRVIARYHLNALSPQDSGHYIAHRLAVAGLAGPIPFDNKALARVHRLSRGVPRRINLLCGRALLGAYAGGHRQVGLVTLDRAAYEVFGPVPSADLFTAVHAYTRSRLSAVSALTRTVLLSKAGGVVIGSVLASVMALCAWQLLQDSWAASTPASSGAHLLAAVEPSGPTALARPAPLPAVSTPLAVVSVANALTAPPKPATVLTSHADFLAALASSTTSENQAWRALGPLWDVSLDTLDACAAAQNQGVFCYFNPSASLPLIRQLNRPGFIVLTHRGGPPTYALLSELTADSARLTLNATSLTVPLSFVAQTWNGSFGTLWRKPPDLTVGRAGQFTDTSTRWLAEQLAGLSPSAADKSQSATTAPRAGDFSARERVNAFQIAQGLAPGATAGPLTVMQLNRLAGVSEPRLVQTTP